MQQDTDVEEGICEYDEIDGEINIQENEHDEWSDQYLIINEIHWKQNLWMKSRLR
jgi:hypothetical protein